MHCNLHSAVLGAGEGALVCNVIAATHDLQRPLLVEQQFRSVGPAHIYGQSM